MHRRARTRPVHLVHRRDEEHVDALGDGDGCVALRITRVGRQILGRRELGRVHERATTTKPVSAAAARIRDRWPSWKKPIVGTKPTVRPPARATSHAAAHVGEGRERDHAVTTGPAAPQRDARAARSGPTRANARCESTWDTCDLFVPALVGCRTTRARATLLRPGGPPPLGHPAHRPPRRHRGSTSASGTSTNARSDILGWGTTRSGSSTTTSPTRSTSTSSVRGPQRSIRTRAACASSRCASASSSRGRARGVHLDDGVQVVGLRRTADRRRLVHRRHRHDVDARCRRELVDRALESRGPVAEVGTDAEMGAHAGRLRSGWTPRRDPPSPARGGAACAP